MQRYKTKSGYTLAYEFKRPASGGQILVFLHGLGGDYTAWDQVINELGNGKLGIVQVDLLSHGYSERYREDSELSIKLQAQLVHELIDHLGVEKGIVIGHCYGGMVALQHEVDYPGFFRGMMLIASSCRLSPVGTGVFQNTVAQSLFSFMGNLIPGGFKKGHRDFSAYKGTRDFNLIRLLSDLRYTGLRSYMKLMGGVSRYNLCDRVGEIKIPVDIIGAECDSIFPSETIGYLTQYLSTGSFIEIQGASHLVIFDTPDQVAERINRFVSRFE
ncbi:alpha/beta hydrolase [Candidatus Dojkabacteria bacterium]|uniref:Alpha/beta hydrolase n=1 Tax=Candidatus Dojkabacteria bacterium TaxID=2099670 RepID=A0A955L7H8_9BACT|nr:alpha/beta hydrolase [Candidatus Dojkabacteria bacterium]